MKIAYFSCSAKFGGVEKIISETINELCKTDEILLIVPKNCEFKDKISKAVKIHEYRSFDKRYNIFLYLEIAKILRKFKPEILHTHAAKATQVGFVLSKFLKFHIVATKHNDRKGKIFNRTKNVIAVSKAVAKTINHKSEIIYFGIKAKNLTPKMPEIFTISAVGRLDAIKGFDALINAVSTLNFNFKLQIIGDGDEKENLQNLINSLNLQNRVFLLGFKENVAEILANSHLQVISSKKEGLGIVLIEGIFYSNVMISGDIGDSAEILGEKFIYTDLSKKISEIYLNYAKFHQSFLKIKKENIKKFSFENYIDKIKKYYKRIVL